MAIAYTCHWNVMPGSDANGGGFDPGQTAGMLTDGAATSATGGSPVFSSASYNFVAGDVGAWIFIASGTNWLVGWYPIVSVASNQATLGAAIGAAIAFVPPTATGTSSIPTLNLVAGCASTASPTSATWAIDYSKQTSAQISFTDLVIAATTTNATSVLNPLGKQMVGNIFNVTSGTNFTVQRVCLQSVSTVTGTFDKSLGTAAATGGHAAMGGGLATIDKGNVLIQTTNTGAAGQVVFIQKATYTTTVGMGNNNGQAAVFVGYKTIIGDAPTLTDRPTYTTATNNITLLSNQFSGLTQSQKFYNIIFTNTASTRHPCFANATGTGSEQLLLFQNCDMSGFTVGIDLSAAGEMNLCYLRKVKITSCTTSCILWAPYAGTGSGLANGGPELYLSGCLMENATSHGIEVTAGNSIGTMTLDDTVFYGNGGHNIYIHLDAQFMLKMTDSACVSGTNDGVHFGSTGGAIGNNFFSAKRCQFSQNGGYGVSFRATPTYSGDWNFFYGNTSGAMNNCQQAPTDVNGTGDPYNSKSTGDFSLNSTAGAGALCSGTAGPSVLPG